MTGEDIRCPIRVPAQAHRSSQRCYYHTGIDGICPSHGNVCDLLKRYRKTGILTDEAELRQVEALQRKDPALSLRAIVKGLLNRWR